MTAASNNAHLQPGVIAEFDSARAARRQIAASFTLDQTVPHDQPGQVSLRFIDMNNAAPHADQLTWLPAALPLNRYPVRTDPVRAETRLYNAVEQRADIRICRDDGYSAGW